MSTICDKLIQLTFTCKGHSLYDSKLMFVTLQKNMFWNLACPSPIARQYFVGIYTFRRSQRLSRQIGLLP